MDAMEEAILSVLREADGPLSAREIAARVYGITVLEAVMSGRSVEVAHHLRHLGGKDAGAVVIRDYPYGVSYCAYALADTSAA